MTNTAVLRSGETTIRAVPAPQTRAMAPKIRHPLENNPLAADQLRPNILRMRVSGSAPNWHPYNRVCDPRSAAASMAIAVIEILYGARPASHLRSRTIHPVYQGVVKRAALIRRIHGRVIPRSSPKIIGRRMQLHRTLSGKLRDCEMSFTVFDGERFRAIAMQLTPRHGDWIMTALEIG